MQEPSYFTKYMMPSITTFLVFYKMQFWQVLTSLKTCLGHTPSMPFSGTLRPADSLLEVFCKKSVPKTFAKFTGKQPESILN